MKNITYQISKVFFQNLKIKSTNSHAKLTKTPNYTPLNQTSTTSLHTKNPSTKHPYTTNSPSSNIKTPTAMSNDQQQQVHNFIDKHTQSNYNDIRIIHSDYSTFLFIKSYHIILHFYSTQCQF